MSKLTIYLIKDEYSLPKDIFKNYGRLMDKDIDGIGNFFYEDSHSTPPSWISNFFGMHLGKQLNIFSASSKAVFLVPIEDRIFALAFGYGRALLEPGAWEERFGLKVALSVIDPEHLRSIDKKNMSVSPKLSKEQMATAGTLADFGINVEQDLIQGVTGKARDQDFGQTVTGKDALNLSVKLDVLGITPFLKKCYAKYKSNAYKENYDWIDQVFEIKDPKTVKKLNNELIVKIKGSNHRKTWMAVPDILPWEDVREFRFKKHSFGNDIDLLSYLSFLTDKERQNQSVEILKKQHIRCISASSGEDIDSWTIYKCLYCEIGRDNEICILSNGKWYQIINNFSSEVSKSFDLLKEQSSEINFPKCLADEREDEYNARAATEIEDACNMDRKMINHYGTHQKIEFCDLFIKNKKLIHVKRYGSSSVLSHLFSQGLVSGELFLSDREFRRKLNKKLPDGYQLENISEKPKPSDYEVVYAIISKFDEELDIPFFSKVNVRNARRRLEAFGYSVSLLKVPTAQN